MHLAILRKKGRLSSPVSSLIIGHYALAPHGTRKIPQSHPVLGETSKYHFSASITQALQRDLPDGHLKILNIL